MQNRGIISRYYAKGYVVFEDNTTLWWLKFLKKGFRHCYIIICLSKSKDIWLELNPMSNQVYIFEHESMLRLDYLNHIKKHKKSKILEVDFKQAPLKCAQLGIFTCVEFVKRIMGIHRVSIITPYQLYKFLIKN